MSFQPPLLSLLSWVFFFLFLYFDAFSLHFCLFERGACDLAYLWAENSFREPVLSAHHVVLRDQLRSSRLLRTCLSAEPFLWASFFFPLLSFREISGWADTCTDGHETLKLFLWRTKKKKKSIHQHLVFFKRIFSPRWTHLFLTSVSLPKKRMLSVKMGEKWHDRNKLWYGAISEDCILRNSRVAIALCI